MDNITFAWWPLLFLAPLPLLIQWLFRAIPKQTQSIYNYSLPYMITERKAPPRASLWWLKWLIWLLLLTAAARPQWLSSATVPIIHQGRNMMIAVDLSGSMQIRDMRLNGKRVSRLVALKHLLGQFVAQRKGDQLGLILFADHAYLQSPLTYDTTTVQHYVSQMQQGLVGNQTAIGEAIGLAVKELLQVPAKQRVLILLTDGQNTAGVVDPLQAAKVAKDNHVTIYTIGIGAKHLSTPTLFGMQSFNPSQDLDEKLLKQIASMTHGQYFRAASSQQMAEIYKKLDKLEPIKGKKQYYRPKQELYFWPLLAAILLVLISPLAQQFLGRRN
ncbi:vWA domain-containing protein [Celerinatantimonas diazotrophica]|uniref:Ca-activated chloride channel family protein n=1 Tax=Celerinatantimonas diazotrophica TaxID=412034 RepID=A0A4V2PSW8_9GAMM|nr:VWA domain-containing protein [Celerinatantimonas diazotrophica]TCK64021.1 Ca-activated chloride channel family protein [Celerinatantimonas diazotrophica]CAG9297112.1 hypothetical protein CEDIAZO_02280 [Celerinatantimonas diazotrophica]